MTGTARLVLEDGRIYTGTEFGAVGRLSVSGVLDRDVRISGDPDRSELPPPDRGCHRSSDR